LQLFHETEDAVKWLESVATTAFVNEMKCAVWCTTVVHSHMWAVFAGELGPLVYI